MLHSPFRFSISTQNVLSSGLMKENSPILGFLEAGEGRISVYGDSNCLDSSHMVTNCFWLLKKIVEFTSSNIRDPILFSDSVRQGASLYIDDKQLPSRRTDVNFSAYSAVMGKELMCRTDSRFEVVGTKGYNMQVRGRNRILPGYHAVDMGRSSNSSFEGSGLKIHRIVPQKTGDSLSNKYFGLFYTDELDMPVLVASHWLVPAIIATSGFLLFLSFWRIRQKRRRRRKGSSSGRYPNV